MAISGKLYPFPNHTLILIALHVFSPALSAKDHAFAGGSATRVRAGLRCG